MTEAQNAAAFRSRLSAAAAHHRRGELAQAEAQYRQILEEHPDCFDAMYLLALCASDRGAPHEALACLGEAVLVDPKRADAWFMRGNIAFGLERFEESADSYARAIVLKPDFAEALNNHSAALRALKRPHQALASAERALGVDPNYAKAYNNRGLIHLDGYRIAAAAEDFRRALSLQPNFAEALHNLGTALMQQRRFALARDAFLRLAALAPGFPYVRGNLLRAKLGCCDWEGIAGLTAAVVSAVERGEHADVPMSFLNICGSAAAQLRCARSYTSARYRPPAVPETRQAVGHPQRDRPIRLAYLSGDFGEHAISYLLAGVFERHDRSRFETIALAWDRVGEGAMRRRLEGAFSQFIDITALGDAEVRQMMRDMGVDIAVDLTGHTLGQRTGIFAGRAAPIQVNYLGLPATMGAGYMDYLIADEFLVPRDQGENYAEQIVWLPCFQPNDDRRAQIRQVSRAEHGLPQDAFIFGSFNATNKLSPGCFDVWMRLLNRVPGSLLWILADDESTRANLHREAACRGIDPQRLRFAGRAPYAEYLARLARIDLFLDSIPFNGGTTSSDALCVGVPVLTCAGQSFSARMSGSLLTYLGLPELITTSLEQYEAAALRLALDRPRLRELEQRLHAARRGHLFFDTDHYRKCLEVAYEIMYSRSAAGLSPASFAVSAGNYRD